MLDKLAGIYYWVTVIMLILGGIMITVPILAFLVIKIGDGIDALMNKKRGGNDDDER